MRVRKLERQDIPVLQKIAAKSIGPYPDLQSSMIEGCYVVVNDQDEPIAAIAVERIAQAYLWVGQFDHPACKLAAIRMLQNCVLSHELKQKGYNEVNGFISPQLAKSFGKRLEKTFGWLKNWPSWVLHLK